MFSKEELSPFLDRLGLEEEPMGIFYSHQRPESGFTPDPLDLPTREREIKQSIDWQAVFGGFSCVMGHIWRARKKKTAAWFDAAHFGCPGGAFWFGFMKPQTETIIHYVSSGVPGQMKGEFYCEGPDALRNIFQTIDPPQAPERYCVVKPLSQFVEGETPAIISFFSRPESLCGLHQLAAFVTNDVDVVASPWGAACTGLVTWPFKYLQEGKQRAVVGGWDPSARKFFKTDELSFSVPLNLFEQMLSRWEGSFLSTQTWSLVKKKIERSKRTWGESS